MNQKFTGTLAAALIAFTALGSYAAKPFGLPGKMKVAPRGTIASSIGLAKDANHKSFPKRVQSAPMQQIIELNSPSSSNNKVRSYATAGGTNLYGYLNYTHDDEHSQGWYQFLSDDIKQIWSDPLFTYDNYYAELQTSWVRDGKLCGYDNLWLYGYFWGQTYYEIDLETGYVETSEDDEDCIWDGGVFMSVCYDPEEDVVYGYASDDYDSEEISDGLFQKASDYPFGYEVIKEIKSSQFNTMCYAMAYNPIDKGIYGITLNNDLVKIDKETGDQLKIAHLNTKAGPYVTGLCFSTVENKWLWNPAYSDSSSAIVSIDPKTGAIETIMEFNPGGDSFGCLAEIGSNVTADSPMRPSIENVNFGDGATTGTITFSMPTSLTDGTPIEGELKWYAKVDNRSYSNGTAQPGQNIDVAYNSLSAGKHTFALYVVVDGVQSAEVSTSFYVGYDRPSQPQNVVLATDNVHWSAVKTGANGGEINGSELVYDVYIDGKLVTTTALTYYRTEVGKGEPYALHQASIVAKVGEMTSVAGYSNKLAAGDAWELPYDLVASADTYQLCKVFVNDRDTDDDTYWNVDPYRDASAFYAGQADSERGDDWLILPAINIPDKDRTYSLYVTAMRVANIYPDAHLEVCIGPFPEPTALNQVILEDFVPQSRDYALYSNPMFKVPEAGTYYIGLHARTGIDNCGVMVHEVRVENNNLSPDSPSAVTNLKAVAGTSGALNATVSFNMPTTTIDGTTIPSTATLTANVTGTETVEVSGKPGEAVSTVVPTAQGDNTIRVVCVYEGKSGDSNTVDVYTGVSIPGYVKDMTVEIGEDMMSCTMKWSAPGPYSYGYVDPATVDYYLVTFDASGNLVSKFIGTGINEYTYVMPEGTRQDLHKIGIQAKNVAGDAGVYMAFTAVMGTPYGLPMADDFEEEELMQAPWVQYDESNVEWFLYPIKNIATEWKDLPGIALCGVGNADADDESTIALPRFTTKDQAEVKVIVKSWTGEQAANTSLQVNTHGMTAPDNIGSLGYTNSDDLSMWKTQEFTLQSSYLEKPWVQLSINSKFSKNHNYAIIDEIQVKGNNDTGVIGVWNGYGSIFGGIGTVTVRGYEGKTGAIYSVDGKVVSSFRMDASEKTLEVPAGIYIVLVGGKSVKLIVR